MILGIVIRIAVMCFIGWLLCDIDPYEEYSWISGIWHGLFLPVNFVRSLIFDDVLYQAARHTTAYSVFYWIFGIISIISFFFGNGRRE